MARSFNYFLVALIVAVQILAVSWLAVAQNPNPPLALLKTSQSAAPAGGIVSHSIPLDKRLYVARGIHLQIIDSENGTIVGDIDGPGRSPRRGGRQHEELGFVTSGRRKCRGHVRSKNIQNYRQNKNSSARRKKSRRHFVRLRKSKNICLLWRR